MKQRWTLQFESLGRIDRGEITLAPMMIFTGQNNTGKSYVMALLWGVIALGRELFPEDVPENTAYQRCDEWLSEKIGQGVPIDEAIANMFIAWFSESLNQHRGKLTDALFGEGQVPLKSLRIKDYQRTVPLKLRWDEGQRDSTSRFSAGKDYVRFPLNEKKIGKAARYRMIRYLTWKLVMDDLSAPLFPPTQPFGAAPRGEILYLPAARTGFMLMRKTLATATMGIASLPGAEHAMPLILPVRRFLQRLFGLSFHEKGTHSDVADRIEQEIVMGTIRPDGAPLPDYQYSPVNQTDLNLPIWLTSSMVTELAPLLIFLRSREDFRTLLIEEPEAHLHPEAQIVLAKALIQLVNAGLPVWLTTHGDNFLQQLSNQVKASSLNNAQRGEHGYQKEECIKPDDVRGYYFAVSDAHHKTGITPLSISLDGIAATSFNETLIRLSQQTLSINAAIDATQ
ncbi:ATP-binding protein [Ectothiorhodospiraceae bacterium BW-2]|nr:ATP-binding protein [Ectothiorhodospiraceae bacterium BW-2]